MTIQLEAIYPNGAYDASTSRYVPPDPMIDGLTAEIECCFLFDLASKYADGVVVEVGSWLGRTTHAFLSTGATVIVVDHFKGTPSEAETFALLRDKTPALQGGVDAYTVFIKNVGHFPNLNVFKMDNVEAAKLIKDGSVDVVFLDADHEYGPTKNAIVVWLPKIKPGGVLCGHDLFQSGVAEAIRDCRIVVEYFSNIAMWIYRVPKCVEKVEVAA